MKCPKCGYLGFAGGERCKNCGYDFSLVGGESATGPGPGSGRPRATPLNLPPAPRQEAPRPRAGRLTGDGHAPEQMLDRPLSRTPDSAPLDLPLFDVELASRTPHRPLGVRRSGTPTPRPRPRAAGHEPTPLALDLDGSEAAGAAGDSGHPAPSASVRESAAPRESASAFGRVAAWVVDAALILLVDVITLYFALRLCGLEPADAGILPPVPLAVFFLILNGGYYVVLTGTLGQTIGKMAMQIEVVADGAAPLGLGRATLRALLAAATLAPAGLGLWWAATTDRRVLHDRLMGTRVVRAAEA